MATGLRRIFASSIRVKILLPTAVILVIMFVTLAVYVAGRVSDEAHLNLRTKARSVANLGAYALGEGVEYGDVNAMKPIVDGIANDPDVSSVAVYDARGIFLLGSGPGGTIYFVDQGALKRWSEGERIPVTTAEAARLSFTRAVAIDILLRTPVVDSESRLEVAFPVMAKEELTLEPGPDGASVAPEPRGPGREKRVGALRVELSTDNAEARAATARLKYSVIAAAGFLLTMLLLAWVVAQLMEPVRELTRVTSEIVLKGDLTQTIQVKSSDEIGLLASAFAQMVEKLRDIPKRLQETTQMLLSSVGALGKSTDDQSQMVSRQAAAVQETQVTVQEIKQTSLLAAQKAEAVLKVAERADEISRQGEVAISQSLGGLADIRTQVDEIAQKIGELQERTRQIGLITETVKDLADQSNMLALNAAIEAVRSGEHGKGFAVVAREIRSLADQSIQATNRVREILDDIGSAIRTAVSITEKGALKMEGGLVQMKQSGENLRELSGIVKDNAAAVRQIAAAVSQQNAGISQIFAAVSDLNQMMDETLARLEHTGKSVDALRDVSTQVSQVVTSFRV
jgi:methyl-accepting chemotaxis protein